ncbi:MAG TPA: TonB-dependent receptor, partial [Steroidobacteraceae bacterium]
AAANNAQARQLAEFGPEKVNAYELGSKWTFAEGTAELNAALFRTDSKDLQVTALIPGGVLTAFAVENAASARNQGAEVELNWRPIQSLVLGARTAYLDAKYSNFSDSQCFGGETATQGCVNGVQSLSGQQLPFSPKFAATLDAEYTWHLVGQWSIAAFVQASYSQSYWTEFVDDPASRQGSYTKYNARLALRSNHLDLALIGRNLSNVYTFAGASQINPAAAGGTADAATIDPPRELILQLRYHF